MELDIVGLVSACSYALDCIEAELVHVTNRHGKRVAYISVCMAERLGIKGRALQDLAICALLHDNALTQYISEEVQKKPDAVNAEGEYDRNAMSELVSEITPKKLGVHCIYGEQNIKKLPFDTDMSGVILYHHENADGTGPFGKRWDEIPLFARIIHICDMVDVIGNSCDFSDGNWVKAQNFIRKNRDILFDSECVDAFLDVFSEENFVSMSQDAFEEELWKKIPRQKRSCDFNTCKNIADFFAQIVDYKSEFTGKHSLGVAQKVAELAEYMGYSEADIEKIYMAGALHDIGKMAIGNEILEKPGRLSDEEFSRMKNHAGYTYMILSDVEDFEEVRDWAAFHHEKLDGTGYPFGRTGAELNEPERIMACVDIYQALTESRPYKSGMTHEKACTILEDMAVKGWIDAEITKKIKECFAATI
jgi:putative nucleotidyltransferase with HDIG domain